MYRKHPIGDAPEPTTGFQRIWLIWVSFGFFLHGVAELIEQVGYWLKHGEWVALPSLYLFIHFDPPWRLSLIPTWFVGTWSWLESPSSWYGVHKIIYGTLESLSIPGISFVIAARLLFIAPPGHPGGGVEGPTKPPPKKNQGGTPPPPPRQHGG